MRRTIGRIPGRALDPSGRVVDPRNWQFFMFRAYGAGGDDDGNFKTCRFGSLSDSRGLPRRGSGVFPGERLDGRPDGRRSRDQLAADGGRSGRVLGSAIGTATAHLLKYDAGEIKAGIYGFNSTLIGIATFFHFPPGPIAVGLLGRRLRARGDRHQPDARFIPIPDLYLAVHRHHLGHILPGSALKADQSQAGGRT